MPRTSRALVGGLCYHVLNRGNARAAVFHKDADFDAFVELLVQASMRHPMRLLAWCLMANHFHLVLWPVGDADVSGWMQWLMNAHVRRYHRHYHTEGQGHIWQGCFKAFPIQADEHLLAVLRYVERNPVRAGLVARAQDWKWSSLREVLGLPGALGVPAGAQVEQATTAGQRLLHSGPVPRPANWAQRVNQAESAAELEALRRSVACGRPLGPSAWVERMAQVLGLGHTLRGRGRPAKHRTRG